jgi:hypothetical protein
MKFGRMRADPGVCTQPFLIPWRCASFRCVAASTAPNDDFPLPEIDENGVDRSQIRAALRMTPIERLRRAQEFAEDTLRIWEQNGIRPLR